MFGLETLFCWVPWIVKWCLSWLPKRGRIHCFEAGVRVSGQKVSSLAPGTYWYLPRWSEVFIDNIVRKVKSIPAETVTMQDGRTVRIGGVLTYRITDIEKWFIENENAEHCIMVDAARVLRNVVASKTIENLTCPSERRRRDDDVTLSGQEGLGAKFGVRVEHLGFTTLCLTTAQDLVHSGIPSLNNTLHLPEVKEE